MYMMEIAPSIRRQDGRSISRGCVISLPGLSPEQLLLFFASSGFLVPLIGDICRIPHRSEREHRHEKDAHGRSSDEDPAHALDFGLAVAAETGADLVVDLLDLFSGLAPRNIATQLARVKEQAYRALCILLLFAHGHLPVVEHAPHIVVERRGLLVE